MFGTRGVDIGGVDEAEGMAWKGVSNHAIKG